ncbi:MAG: RNA polymerase sigma factor [Ruminiclostridium sp.]|nr:RNA polymerase sigma factor [Ruminiclostridium sp.]
MDEKDIITLYKISDENAIRQTEKKYSAYLTKIALNILGNREDSEECVNNTYFKAWNTIPPNIPAALKNYLGKITRELSIDRLRKQTSRKRSGSEYDLSLEELAECAGSDDSTLQSADFSALVELIEKFLKGCGDNERDMFICRYYFCDSLKEIAEYFGVNVSKVKNTLFRTRAGLKKYLESEGYEL